MTNTTDIVQMRKTLRPETKPYARMSTLGRRSSLF